jgi:hypothetical protein
MNVWNENKAACELVFVYGDDEPRNIYTLMW